MGWDYSLGSPYGDNTIWGGIGRGLSGLGQSAYDRMSVMRDMASRRDEAAYKQLQLILSMPGVTDDQKRSAIQRFQGTINKGGRWDPAWSGFQWPTTPPTPGR